jgi:histidine triad (HIT) family protein
MQGEKMNTDCIFCKIVNDLAPSHTVWEDEKHIAFLSIFPNTPGVTVVATKQHLSSCVYQLDQSDYQGIMLAARTVCQLLDAAFPDVARTGMIAEGFGVDHAHIKLFPMHGTAPLENWRQISSDIDVFFEEYPGYLSSHDSALEKSDVLKLIAKQIRNAQRGD